MPVASTVIAFTSSSGADTDIWLNLEQEPLPLWADEVLPSDIMNMVYAAETGLTAASYQARRCPNTVMSSDGVLTTKMGLYVWPASLALEYELRPAGCELGTSGPIELWREIDVAFDGSSESTLPYNIDPVSAQVYWQTGCYNQWSEAIESPVITVSTRVIRTDSPCFGVARVLAKALGYRHEIICDFNKAAAVDGELTFQVVTQHVLSVTAVWLDEEGKEQSNILELEMSKCVSEMLDLCPNGQPRVLQAFGPNPTGKRLRVFYDACRGDVLRSYYVDEDSDE